MNLFLRGFLVKIFILILLIYPIFQVPADEKKEIEDFIDTYFKTWSKGDILSYSNLFYPTAVIQFREKNGKVFTENIGNFIEGQRLSQSNTADLLTEVPTSKKIDLGKELSFARVSWKMTGRGKFVTGWDYFILIKIKDTWKIQYLLFSND
jgi:hypothetical protein